MAGVSHRGGLGGGRNLGGSRRSDTEIRQAMIDAGQELVAESDGLTVSLEHLSYEDVISRAGVSRTAAYRVWPYKHRYYVDLISALAGPSWQGTAAFDQETQDLARSIVAGSIDQLETADGRLKVLNEAIRRAARQNYEAVTRSPHWRTYVAITATLMSTPDGDDKDQVLGALRNAENRFVDLMAIFYDDMLLLLGLHPLPPFQDLRLLAATGAAVVEGLALRSVTVPELVNQTFKVDGEEWTLPAIGFRGILTQLVQPVPDYDAHAALAEYAEREARRARRLDQ